MLEEYQVEVPCLSPGQKSGKGIKQCGHEESKDNESEEVITKAELRKSIISFTWPCMAELMLISMISIVNLSMVGHLGAFAISAVGLTNQPVFISIAVFQSFNIGATALVARFIGAKEYANAKTVVIQTLIVSVISGAILGVIGFVFSEKIVSAMGAKADTMAPAALYMKYMAVGMVFQSIPTAITSLLRGAGDTKSPMHYNIAANVVNVAAGMLLIYGFWFIPGLGVQGAAIGATLAKITSCVLSVIAIIRTRLPVVVSVRDSFHLDGAMLKRIMNIGMAAAGEQFAMRVGFLIFTKLIADLGTVSFAAHQVCISITGLSFNFGQALGMAATSFMGRNLGAQKPELAQAYCTELRRIAMVASIFISALFFFGGSFVASFFTKDLEVIAISAFLLKIIVLMTPAQNSSLVIAGGLRGAGDTKWPLYSIVAGVLFIRVPLALILIKGLGFGVGAAWAASVIDQFVRSVVVYIRFMGGKWKLIKV